MALENYTTYTKVDPNGRFTLTTNKTAVSGMTRNEAAYVYDDKGIAHFCSTCEHKFDVIIISDVSFGQATTWAVSNALNDRQTQFNNSDECMLVFLQPASNIFRLENIEAGTLDQAGVSIGTQYYCTIERTSVTAIELRIYSDSGRTTLIDTLTQSIPSEVS